MCVCVSEKVFAYIWAYPHPFPFVCFLSPFKDHLCTPASCALGIDFKIPDDYLSNCIVTILHSQAPSYVTIPCEPQCSHLALPKSINSYTKQRVCEHSVHNLIS